MISKGSHFQAKKENEDYFREEKLQVQGCRELVGSPFQAGVISFSLLY